MLPKTWTRAQTAIAVWSLVYALIFILVLICHPGGPLYNLLRFHHPVLSDAEAKLLDQPGKVYKNFFNHYQIIAPVFGGVCGLLYVLQGQHRSQSQRIGWTLIALGSLAFAIGQITWTYYESYLGSPPSGYSWADLGYLGAYPFLIIGVLFLFGSMHMAGRARLLLDSALAASSIGIVSWYFLVQQLWKQTNLSLFARFVNVAYPLCDVVTLFCAFMLIYSVGHDRGLRRSYTVLAGGLTLVAFADSLYSYANFASIYQTGSWFDWGWSFGWMLVGIAPLLLWWQPQTEPAIVKADYAQVVTTGSGHLFSKVSWPMLTRVLLPYVAAAAAFAFVARHDYHIAREGTHYLSNTVLMLGAWLICIVILRQVLTLVENQHLTAVLRVFNERLEQMVERRTKQLIELHQLTKAINTTLVEDEVLATAVRHTQQALQADAVVLRLIRHNADDSEEAGRDGMPALEAPGDAPKPPIYLSTGLENRREVADYIVTLPVANVVEVIDLPESFTREQDSPTYLRAPLLFHQEVVGSIGVIRWGGGFGRTEPEMLESIGLEVGIAYENARRYRIAVEAADRDAVTGLYNHRAIHQRLEAEYHRATRNNSCLSLMMLDLNNFKLFNDTYGHPVGDQVLKRVSRLLESECRVSDILGRYGGDEFLVVLPDTDEALAMVVAQRLRDRMMAEDFRGSVEGNIIPVSLSCGIANYPHDGTNRHELLAIADANLYTAKLSKEGIVGTTETQRTNRELRAEESFGVLDAMVTAVDNKDAYTRRHSEDVTEYALWIAEEMALSEETMRIIRIGGLLHDVGKIGVPDDILRKPGKLTNEEFEVMKRHPLLGALIVGGVPGMEPIIDAVRSHHERWDGKGYPDGLAGEAIPLLGRILAVPDAVSAMTTHRAYRKGLAWEQAVAEIRANIGTQFDPQIARAFLTAAEKRRNLEAAARALEASEIVAAGANGNGSQMSPHGRAETVAPS